jgi:hypothetical protein
MGTDESVNLCVIQRVSAGLRSEGLSDPPFDGGLRAGIGDFVGIYCYINQSIAARVGGRTAHHIPKLYPANQ